MSDGHDEASAVRQKKAKPKPRYADLVYELHRRQQLDSFLEILLPFAAEDVYVRQTHLYNSFVALCADTPMSYEQGEWHDDTQSAWERYIWDVMETKIKAYMDEADILSQGADEWDTEFKGCLRGLHYFILEYAHSTGQEEQKITRLAMAENFYRLVLHMFDVPHKVYTREHALITAFCPVEGKWCVNSYKNERLRVHYQHDKKMMDFLKHAAWLFWDGDDIAIRRVDELTDKRITPMVKEYAKLRSHVLSGEFDEPIYAALAREVLYPTAHKTLTDASNDTEEAGPAYDSPEDESNPNPSLLRIEDLRQDALLPRTATQLTPKPASVRSMLHLLRADGA